ncbi:MAG: glycosyltransferase family 10 [Pirellulaceae bacterium]
MKRLRIAFSDFWRVNFDPCRNFLHRYLRELYDLEFSDTPDVLFYSCFGRQHRRYKCLKIYYTGENRRPDWHHCDYAITYDHLDHPDHYRLPNYAHSGYGQLQNLVKDQVNAEELLAAKTGFCNFIYSNPNCPPRNQFFRLLSKYKRVDAGGKLFNNLGGPIAGRQKGKMAFIAKYKFTIAFENGSHPGYTTEKLAQPMWAGSLPIYWGNPLVQLDFNPHSFLNYFDYGSQQALVERVIELDQDDRLYAEVLRQPWLHDNRVPAAFEKENVQQFLQRAIETPRQPVATLRRSSLFGLWTDWWPWATRAGAAPAA